jgi:hypothetical protein
MRDIGVTKGEWWPRAIETNGTKGFEVCYSEDEECITDHVYTKSDAILIVDAGNTAQKCNLLPSELLAQRDQLIKVLEMWQRVRVTDQLEYNAARHVDISFPERRI